MKGKLGKKFFVTLVLFGMIGQVAWVVENMYFNVFIYKMFNASATQISLMVSLSAITATLTTLIVGAYSDKVGKRKIFICLGYIAWGVSILAFMLMRVDVLQQFTGSAIAAASLGVTLVIVLDCIMTFFGSSANDACFNAWMTDCGDETNRGRIEGINAMMPLVAILVVFGGFMAFDLNNPDSFTVIFLIIGLVTLVIGVAGFFLIEEKKVPEETKSEAYIDKLLYSFRISTYKKNRLLYVITGAFAVFGISIQIFMPYLILYYEKTLGMADYVLIMAPAIIIASVITAFYGKLYDLLGFETAVVPTVLCLLAGYTLLYFCTGTVLVFTGSLLMMTGYLTGMAMFGAMIRDNIPEDKAGLFQGLRIFGQVFVPGVIGPLIGAFVLRNAATIMNSDGTTSFLPNHNIFLAAFIVAVLLFIGLFFVFRMMHTGRRKLTSDIENSSSDIPYDIYPRPQLKRDSYICLNGEWELGGGKITVPYPPQSDLSGYDKHIGSNLVCRRTFTLPEGFYKDRVLLHFGAVDQVAEVIVNNVSVKKHEGGYLPFFADITEVLLGEGKENELVVKVTDTLSTDYPYGKQRKKRGGMWYTPVSGIWQSVWLESVPTNYIRSIKIDTDTDKVRLKIDCDAKDYVIKLHLETENVQIESQENEVEINLRNLMLSDGTEYVPKLWTTETPHLYYFSVETENDRVESYFALRKVEVREIEGVNRICLNGKPIFLHAVLDQGYYCDGIYLPKTPKGYTDDILNMKELGFNTLRKHIKIEPECFYYDCDRLGMLVMQDMVNSGKYSFIRDTALPTLGRQNRNDVRMGGTKKRKDFFIRHMEETVAHLYNHPCIVYYTIFNEGWGQFDSDRMYDHFKTLDNTRVVDTTSGWFAGTKSDVVSQHIYFKLMKPSKTERPFVISECGGYAYTIKEHSYSLYGHYGYGNCMDEKELTDHVVEMYEKMIIPYIGQGLAGCVYTQLSDVEDETNGFYTYDRKVCKVEKDRLRNVSEEILKNKTLL